MQNNNERKESLSRRKFLKASTVVGVGTTLGLAGITNGKSTEKIVKAIGVKELNEFPYEISSDFKRFDQKRTEFSSPLFMMGLAKFNPEAEMFVKLLKLKERFPEDAELIENLPGYMSPLLIDESKPGYTTLDRALQEGADSIVANFSTGSDGGVPNSPIYTWDKKPVNDKYEFSSKKDASKAIKRAAKLYKADLVGITAYDERWVYGPLFSILEQKDIYDTEFPFKPKSVIVLGFEMDYEGMSSAPSNLCDATANMGYAQMAEVNYKLSTFIRNLGYNAFGAGNDTAESVPYAIAAGLGEQGRLGLLVTYEYGPRVRICKIFTDMELEYDKPIEFGANEFCKVCKKCAVHCPSQSISHLDDMTFGEELDVPSLHKGVKKYYVNARTCHEYWQTIGNACSVCVSVCPYNKPDFWHHRITTALTATPLKPFLNEMDDLFGYGQPFDEKAAVKFWGFDTYIK